MIVSFLVVDIVADEPFAVATPEASVFIDRPVAKDPAGRAIMPTTSLAGSLRHHLNGLGLDEMWMGSTNPLLTDSGAGERSSLTPSRLRLLGTSLRFAGAPIDAGRTQLRQQTAMDRRRAAPAAKTLRTSQVLPEGASVRLYARADAELPLGLLDAIASWQPVLGGGRTIGQGASHVESVRHGRLDTKTPAGLRRWLLEGGPGLAEAVAETPHPVLSADWARRTATGSHLRHRRWAPRRRGAGRQSPAAVPAERQRRHRGIDAQGHRPVSGRVHPPDRGRRRGDLLRLVDGAVRGLSDL